MLHFDPDAVPVTSPACQSGFSHYCTGTRNPLKVLHTHTYWLARDDEMLTFAHLALLVYF